MDHASREVSRAGGQVDVADTRGICPTAARQGRRRRPAPALGAAPASDKADPDAGVEGFRHTLASGRHACECAETLRKVARQADGAALGPGETLSGH